MYKKLILILINLIDKNQQQGRKMQKSLSRSSFKSKSINQKYLPNHNQLLLNKIQSVLQEASLTLSHQQFQPFYLEIVSRMIKKFQSQSLDKVYIQQLQNMTTKYGSDIYLTVKILFLKAKNNISIFPQQTLTTITKIKHILIDSQFQYLLSKFFILQSQTYAHLNRKDLQIKSLFKSIQFAQNYVLQYLNEKQETRKQITQNIIIAYFQLFKLKKQQNHKEAEQFLKKACRTTQKTYGFQSQVTELLNVVYNDHKNIGKGLNKINFSIKQSQKAITEILKIQIKKDTLLYGYYSWEDEKLIGQLIKSKFSQSKIVSQAQYEIKLDMAKINQLKNSDWIKIERSQVIIIQQEIFKVAGIKNENTATTKIQIKTILREDIIKKDNFSSSSQDPSFIEREDFNFIRRLGRSQSAKRQLN